MNSIKEIYRHLAENHQVYLPKPELEKMKQELEDLIPKLGYFRAIKEVEKIALAMKHKHKSPAFGAYKATCEEKIRRSVIMIDGDNEKKFESIYACAKNLKIKNASPNILKVCNGERKTAYGFKFRWA